MKKYILHIIVCLLLISACKRTIKDKDSIGPDIISVPEGFMVVNNNFSIGVDSVDLATSDPYFAAVFSDKVSWNVEIKGLSSGAIKKIRNISSGLSALNSFWTGDSDNLFLFKKNETAVARLSFFGTSFYLTDTFVVKEPNTYPGILVSDFEGNGLILGWSTFWTTGKFLEEGVENTISTPEGDYYFHLKGNDFDATVGVGGMLHTSVSYGLTGDPSSVYMNVYINGTPNTRLDLRVIESDGDEYTTVQTISWTGWKLVSVPYDEFNLTSASQVDGQNPDRCVETKFLIKSSPAGSIVEANLDYIIFTNNKPFEP